MSPPSSIKLDEEMKISLKALIAMKWCGGDDV